MSEMKTVIKGTGLNGYAAGANPTAIDIKDGKIIRFRPLDYTSKYPVEQLDPWTITVKGHDYSMLTREPLPTFAYAYQRRIYSKNRILYPYKREDWDPKGERNPQNRGKSKFVRISWDEAAQLIADEITRIGEEYGYRSVLVAGDGHGEDKNIHAAHGAATKLFQVLGSYTYQARQPDSWEGWYWGSKHMWGGGVGQGEFENCFVDMCENCEMLLLWGCDMETTPWGWTGQVPSTMCFYWSKLGMKQVYVCPDVNYGAAVHADKWIPILPNTDGAMQCAIAWIWLTEGTYNDEFVHSHCVGFDGFRDYILGKEDGIPKTPEWASPSGGVPVRQIKALARQWAKKSTTIGHGNGGGMVRGAYSHEPARLEVCLLAMQGLWKPGQYQIKFIEWNEFSPGQQPFAAHAHRIDVHSVNHGYNFVQPDSFIPKTLIPKAILGDYTAENPLKWNSFPLANWPREDQYITYQYPIEGANPIHMYWTDTPCWNTCWNCGNDMVKALRDPKIECVVAQQPWLENDCLYADILLPISTKFEEEDIMANDTSGHVYAVYYEGQCIDPLGESKSDWEAVCEVAKKLGVYEELTGGKTVADWVKEGFEKSGVADKISFEEFMENGFFPIHLKENWQDSPHGFQPFVEDPENHPLDTPTGLLEIYSAKLEEVFPGDEERPPSPRYIHVGESHEERLDTERGKKYPFLLVTNHPRWRIHANMDDIPWFREIETCKVAGPDGYLYEPCWINPRDAEKLGVETGDVVKIFNERGWTLGGVYVTERIMERAVYQDHGARIDPIEPGVSDRGGANNLLAPRNITSKNAPGEVTNGYLVGVEKVDVFELAKQYPEAFGRVYDPTEGVDPCNWLLGER